MANTSTTKKKNSATSSSKQPTAAEMRDWYSKHKKTIENFEKLENGLLQLVDPTKSTTKTFTTFSKETLRTYMKNPARNYKNLRNLSKFLYYVSQAYRRLVHYYANMPDLRYRSIIPRVDLNKGFSSKDDIQSYYDTVMFMDELPLSTEFYKMLVKAWVEDAAFGVAYFTDKGNGRYDMFILPLQSDYCVITGLYPDGSIAFDFDMTYFSGSNADMVEWFGEPFTTMYEEYQKDTRNNRYQPVPDDVAVALKVNLDTPDDILMPFMGMFASLISLNDLVEISAIADEQEIYKLLSVKVPLLNSDSPDDFAIDINTAVAYYNQLVNNLPDYTNAALLPGMDIDEISFDNNKVNDVSKVEQATKEVFNSAGGGQVLHNVNISGSTGLNLAMKTDELQALKPLLGEIEGIMNRLASYQLKNPAKIKFLEVTKYTSEEYKDSLIKSMNYGLPFAMTIGTLSGYSESDLIAMANVNNALGLTDLFKPMATASTRSAEESTGGAPTKSDTEITDDGESSRDKKENAG